MDISRDIALMQIQPRTTRNRLDRTDDHARFNQELRKSADGFEELFVHKLLQVMRGAGKEPDLLSGGHGEEIFQDMLDENYAKIITENKAFGLSDIIYEQNKKPS
jgi:peptidoglycan hydrolase FlgJ